MSNTRFVKLHIVSGSEYGALGDTWFNVNNIENVSTANEGTAKIASQYPILTRIETSSGVYFCDESIDQVMDELRAG